MFYFSFTMIPLFIHLISISFAFDDLDSDLDNHMGLELELGLAWIQTWAGQTTLDTTLPSPISLGEIRGKGISTPVVTPFMCLKPEFEVIFVLLLPGLDNLHHFQFV